MSIRPPLAARVIFALTADEGYHAPIVGDLNEEFIRRREHSRRQANFWYLRQAFKSIPFLLWIRVIERPRNSRSAMLLAGVLTYGLIMIWDGIVGSYLTSAIGEQLHNAGPSADKYISGAATLLAVMLSGGAIAGFFFDENQSLRKNMLIFLPSIYGMLVFLAGFKRLFVNCENSVFFQLTFIASVAPALALGAASLYWVKKIANRP